MKLHGVEGMSPENIRDEVHRGGRLVIYRYCVSVFVLTLRRPSDIYLIKAGHSPVTAGLPFVAISLLFGWWGFPWGPIYTVESVYRNLSGGEDVTEGVLRQILPAAAVPAPPPAPTTFAAAVAPRRGFNLKVAGFMAISAVVLIAGGVSIYCFQQQQNLTVALVSGLDTPYTVTLNGTPYALPAHRVKILSLPEGDVTVQDAEGGHVVGAPQTFHFATPFFSHLDHEQVAVINPDRAAVLLNEEVRYYPDNATPLAREEPVYSVLANQPSYFIAKPDYVLVPAEHHISMPSGSTRTVKTHLELLTDAPLSGVLGILGKKSDYAAVREHVMILARSRGDEAFLQAALGGLKPEDFRAFFATRLGERPVQVEWHRYYQETTQYNEPARDLLPEYQAALRKEPGNGALMYLLGRITPDQDAALDLFRQALRTEPPCPQALAALGYDALCEARFQEALDQLTAAEKAGVTGKVRRQYRREVYFALGRYDDLLAEIAADRQATPLDVTLAAEDIKASLAAGKGDAVAIEKKTKFLAALRASHAPDDALADSDAYLQSVIDYQAGRLQAYAGRLSRFDAPFYKFRAAFARGELKAAADAALGDAHPRPTPFLLLYLLAKRAGDDQQAERHFAHAVELMRKQTASFRQAAELVAAPRPDPAGICRLHLEVEDKRVLLTALELHDPANAPMYRELADKLNYDPDFPREFLRTFLEPAGKS